MDAASGNNNGGGLRVKAPVNPWIVAFTVTLATFMEVLDTSIANVVLPYISGGMAVGRSQSTWVLTSYLVANAIVLPLSGWLMGLFVKTFFTMTVIGLVAFAIWELHHPNPMINLRLLGERNFLTCGLILYLSFAVLYGSNVVTPQMLQELFGYDAFHAGVILSPAAFFTMGMLPVVGFLMGKKVDARTIIPLGLVCLAGVSYWQAHLNLNASPYTLIAPRCVQMLGVGMLWVPLNNAAYLYLSQHQVNNAAGLLNMLRNEGGSLGIAMVTVLVDRRGQFHQLRLAEHVTRLNPAVNRWTDHFAQTRMIRGGVTRAVADQQGMGLLSQMVHNQAREMAYLDPFWVFAIMALLALPLILLMKKAVAKGGVAVH